VASRTTRTLSIATDDPDPAAIEQAAELIRGGGLVAFATETVYGLGADATSAEAIDRIYWAKGRPGTNPLIVHIDTIDRGRFCVADWPEHAEILARAFWPGPLTLVLPRSEAIPDAATAGLATVGIRMPRPASARRLVAAAGLPIAAPSANRSNRLSPTTAAHVLQDLDGRIDLILDSGPTDVGLESTIVDLTTREPRILRPGPITGAELQHVLKGLHVRHAEGESSAVDASMLSPGRMPVHYAPRTRTVRVRSVEQLDRIDWPERSALVVLGSHERSPEVPDSVHEFDLSTPELAARELYATLHACDALDLELIVILPPADLPEWQAIRDRVQRASKPAVR
jgi:L-threonylcarbamoyladenylate synthase